MDTEPRSVAPEHTALDKDSYPCLCGAMPLLTATGKLFYMSCPPCWVRTHKVPSAELARAQWQAMLDAKVYALPAANIVDASCRWAGLTRVRKA